MSGGMEPGKKDSVLDHGTVTEKVDYSSYDITLCDVNLRLNSFYLVKSPQKVCGKGDWMNLVFHIQVYQSDLLDSASFGLTLKILTKCLGNPTNGKSFLPFRDLRQHLHLQPRGHRYRTVQRHLQPAQVSLVADPIPRLPRHCRHLGAVPAHHGALPGVQRPPVLPQARQDGRPHVPPELAQSASRADLVGKRFTCSRQI